MLSISARDLGHRFAGPWLYRGLSFSVAGGNSLCILGPNGSGKSTLLRIIAGQLAPAEGTVEVLTTTDQPVPVEARYRHVGWAAPGLELYGPLTVAETLHLHFGLRPCRLAGGVSEALAILELDMHHDKPLRHLSSGMQQRLLLGLALFAEGNLLLLDEPTSHMDEARAQQALQWIAQYQAGRTVVLASNLPREAERFPQQLRLTSQVG